MTEPLVCAIMLTKDRPEMARRAVASFRAQAYTNKRLFVYDTGKSAFVDETFEFDWQRAPDGLWTNNSGAGSESDPHYIQTIMYTVGALRNSANAAAGKCDVFIHFDDDDYSHPNRIAEQVGLLQSSGADCVGYNEVLFWKTQSCTLCDDGRNNVLPRCQGCGLEYDPNRPRPFGEAWIYRSPRMSPAIGSSLCYWRSTWERRPFADAPKAKGATSEYYEWLRHCNVKATSSVSETKTTKTINTGAISAISVLGVDPRLICSIHGGNTQCYDIEALIEQGSREWTRTPGFDAYARKVMAL